jgi:outer membrane lipoprotein LolB
VPAPVGALAHRSRRTIDSGRDFLNNPRVRLLLFAIAAVISACAVAPERAPLGDPASVWQQRQVSLARIRAWDLRGRLWLRSADEGFNLSLQWRREADRHRIDLTGPLGGGRVRLTQDRHGAELRDASDVVDRDASVQQLLARRTGWDLPLDGLNYWVLGLPAPDAPTQSEIDSWGRLKTLEQFGWDIRFLEYVQQGGHELPSRVFIKRRHDAADRTLEVRLVVEKWAVAQ